MKQRQHTRIGVIAVVAVVALIAVGSGGVAADAPASGAVSHSDATDPSDPVILDRDRDATVSVDVYGTFDPAKVEIAGDDGSFAQVSTSLDDMVRYHATPQEIGATETVDVIYNGTVIKTVTVETVERDTQAFNITASELKSADSVNVSYPANETSFYLQVLDFAPSSRSAAIGVSGADKLIREEINKSTNATANLTAATAGTAGSPVADYQTAIVDELPSDTSQDVQLVASGHVSEIEIDGETVYDGDAPLGGGGGGGSGSAPIVLIAVGGVVLLLLGREI